MAEPNYFQWQKENLKEQERILRELKPLQMRIESRETDKKRIEVTIARLSNPRRLEDVLVYFSKANINEEIRRRFVQADVTVLDTVIYTVRDTIGDALNDFHKDLPENIQKWKDRGSKDKDDILAWVKNQSAKIQDTQKNLESVIRAVDASKLGNRLSVINILSDPGMRAIIADELHKLEDLQAAIDYAPMTKIELDNMIQDEKRKLEELEKEILEEKTKALDLERALEPVEHALYITEEKYLSEFSSKQRVSAATPPAATSPAILRSRTKKWCFVATPVYDSPNGTKRPNIPNHIPIPQRTVVELTGQQQNINDSLWSEIMYEYSEYSRDEKKWVPSTITGWVNAIFLDDYNEEYPNDEVKILHPTENPNDAQQYMVLDGDEKYNMCGELSVAYIVKNEIDPESSIESVLEKWKDKSPAIYNSRVGKGRNAELSKDDVGNILNSYSDGFDMEPYVVVITEKPLKVQKIPFVTDDNLRRASDEMQKQLKDYYFIVLLTIDMKTGALIPKNDSARNHWVVLDRIMRNGNRVELYNPFPNKRQAYSFNEFFNSVGTNPNSGWWVKRKNSLVQNEDNIAPQMFGVQLDTPRPADYKAEQYIDRENGKKTELCGEFCVTYIVGKSIDGFLKHWKETPPSGLSELVTILSAYGYYSKDDDDKAAIKPFSIGTVLDHWKDTQPSLYEYHVGKNMPTGTRELKTILKAYGYTKDDLEEFNQGLTDKSAGYLPSPGRIKQKLETHFLIAGVGIDKLSGKLISGPNGVRHWEVLEKLDPVGKHYVDKHFGGNGGWVELYNPFTNIFEEYSYREFTNSMSETGNWAGLWVKRNITPAFAWQEVLPPNIEEKDGRKSKKKEVIERWGEKKLLAEIDKKITNGKPVEKIPALLFREGSGWSIDEIARRLPATKQVGANLTADIEALICERLGVDSIPPEIGEWIRDKSDRDSLLAAELAYALRESGILAVQDKKASIINLEDPALPVTLQAAITGRIVDDSKPSSQMTLKVASAIGVTFALTAADGIKKIRAEQAADNKKKALLENRAKPVMAYKSLAEFVTWTDSLAAAPGSNLYKVRKWGDPTMTEFGFDVNIKRGPGKEFSSNFQAVSLYNQATGFGAVKNFLIIPPGDVLRLEALQVEDEYQDKRPDWLHQKMNWLCQHRGSIYMFADDDYEGESPWRRPDGIQWGTLALGGNLVQVEEVKEFDFDIRTPSGIVVRKMARLAGFSKKDWSRPLDELLAAGLVHRCFSVNKGNGFGDSPKGIVYSPFWSLWDWEFMPKPKKAKKGLTTATPRALYIPFDYLVKPNVKPNPP